jgi:hypothetical protein
MAFTAQRALILYSGVLTAAAAIFLLSAATVPARQKIAVLDVERINIREPDGTLRMTISDAARSPGMIVKGHEYPHPDRRSAGMIFFNDEGTENGGLIFSGREVNGRRSSVGSLTFDRYEQDQVVQMMGSQEGPDKSAGLLVNDQPDTLMDFPALVRTRNMPADQRRAELIKAHFGGTRNRLFAGRAEDGAAQVALKDAAGHERLILAVAPDGTASIRFLDENGKVVRIVQP